MCLSEDSLKLIHVNELQLSVFASGEAFGKRRLQARWTSAPLLWVTDPVYERRYLAKPNGDYRIGECFLTASLGEPFDGACYKLIATVFSRERG